MNLSLQRNTWPERGQDARAEAGRRAGLRHTALPARSRARAWGPHSKPWCARCDGNTRGIRKSFGESSIHPWWQHPRGHGRGEQCRDGAWGSPPDPSRSLRFAATLGASSRLAAAPSPQPRGPRGQQHHPLPRGGAGGRLCMGREGTGWDGCWALRAGGMVRMEEGVGISADAVLGLLGLSKASVLLGPTEPLAAPRGPSWQGLPRLLVSPGPHRDPLGAPQPSPARCLPEGGQEAVIVTPRGCQVRPADVR